MRSFLRIPPTLSQWPWTRRANPFEANVRAETLASLKSSQAFPPATQSAFEKSNLCLLSSLTFPDADQDHLRAACDMMVVVFLFDDQTDATDPTETQQLVDIVIHAIENSDLRRPHGEPAIGEIARRFWARAAVKATASGRARFVDQWRRYIQSIVQQSQDRDEKHFHSTDDYLTLRRYTIGAEPCYALAVLTLDLPLDVTDLPIFKDLRRCVTDMIILDNDLVSYLKEHAAGDDTHNIIALVMHEKQFDLDAAVSWLLSEYAKRVHEVLDLWPKASSMTFGSDTVDNAAQAYLSHLVNWPRGNQCWSFECGRYFGKDGLRVQQEGMVELKTREAS